MKTIILMAVAIIMAWLAFVSAALLYGMSPNDKEFWAIVIAFILVQISSFRMGSASKR